MNEFDIFSAALEREDAISRTRYLDEACHGRPQVRERIEALLQNAADGYQFLETPPPVDGFVYGQPIQEELGTEIGPFQLIEKIGQGGMAVVYEAEEVSLGRRVALKILPFAALLNQNQLERFNTEVTAAARLQHSGIVTIYSVGCESGIHYYSMQLIDGPSLGEVIAEMQRVGSPVDEEAGDTVVSKRADVLTRDEDGGHYRAVARIGKEAAEALHYAHENGVLHRDIKPSNLLLDKTGHLWIADFGLARVEDESQLTRTGDILGTLRYMSPEQATGERVDARSDVYSLGATLYELATLKPVFDYEDRREIIKHVIAGNPIAPHTVDDRIPKPLSLVISKSMARLDERYQSAQELADDLGRFLDGEPVHARALSPLRRVKTTLLRHPIIAISSIALLIVACLYIPSALHRFSTFAPNESPPAFSTNAGDTTTFRNAPKKRRQDAGEVGLADTVVLQSSSDPVLTITNPSTDMMASELDPQEEDVFGWAVESMGNNVLVAAHKEDPEGIINAGTVYLFDGSNGDPLQTFTSPDPRVYERFGASIAAVGDNVLVGTRRDHQGGDSQFPRDPGVAYLFNPNLGGEPVLIQTFHDPNPETEAGDPATDNWFGGLYESVASYVAGDGTEYVLIGSQGGLNDPGAVYMYQVDGDDPYPVPMRTFTAPVSEDPDEFGKQIEILGNKLLVSSRAGTVYLFDINNLDKPLQEFVSPEAQTNDGFGGRLEMTDQYIFVSAINQDVDGLADVGVVYMFDVNGGPEPVQTFHNPNPGPTVFGSDLEIRGDHILITAFWDDFLGDYSGAGYLFTISTGEIVATFFDPTPAGDWFGARTAVLENGNFALGCGGDDAAGHQTGSVFVFESPHTTTDQTGKHVPVVPESSNE